MVTHLMTAMNYERNSGLNCSLLSEDYLYFKLWTALWYSESMKIDNSLPHINSGNPEKAS